MRVIEFIKSEKGQNLKLILDFSVAILLFIWLLKNHNIIKS
jgi:hypothetical protein